MRHCFLHVLAVVALAAQVRAFHTAVSTRSHRHTVQLSLTQKDHGSSEQRRAILRQFLTVSGFTALTPSAFADEESFAAISARANQISQDMSKETAQVAVTQRSNDKTAYDFFLPMEGKDTPFKDIVGQSITESGDARVKAILVVNLKQDDPIARKTIPELIALATKYGRDSGALRVIVSPSDQGYYEPDTSQLIRLKLASEYGYGINPSTIVTDKVNFLGTGAHPFWRWLQASCRTPAGLGRVEGNFEKFLLDGRTGLPLRRYPRKYKPLNMEDDIAAVLNGKPLPPPRANWQEEWRAAAAEADRDTYRFQKGLNYYDQ
jgi:glutathione peroxidase